GGDGVARFFVQNKAHGEVDNAVLRGAPAAEVHADEPAVLRSDAGDISAGGGGHLERYGGGGQERGVVHGSPVAALGLDELGELCKGGAVRYAALELFAGVRVVGSGAGFGEYAGAEREA